MSVATRGGRSMPDIISESFAICVRFRRPVFAATAIPAVLIGLLTVAITIVLDRNGAANGDTSTLSSGARAGVALTSLIFVYISLASYVAAQILVFPVVSAAVRGGQPSARPRPGAATAVARGTVVASIILSVSILLSATVVGLPVAIFLVVRWSFAGQTLARSEASPVAALRASWHTVKGSWLRVAAVLIAIALLGILPRLVLLPISATFNNTPVDAIVAVAGALLAVPFVSVATVLLYIDVLARKGEQPNLLIEEREQ